MAASILKRLSIPFCIACTIGLICNAVLIIVTVSDSVMNFSLMSWICSSNFFALTYPIFCSVPFCWIMYYEQKNGYLNFVHTRVGLKKYLLTHYMCGAVMAFVCIFFISFSGAIISLYIVNPVYTSTERLDEFLADFMGEMKIYKPLLYGFVLSLWRGFIGILMYTFSFLLSLNSRHLFVILTGGFIYSILENFATAIIGYSNISLCYSFDPDSLNWNAFSLSPYISVCIGPLVLIVFCLIQLLYYIKQKGSDDGKISPKVLKKEVLY